MSVGAAREHFLVTSLVRLGARLGMAGLFLLTASNALQTAIAEGDTRTIISFHHVHTEENITITYKRNGRYDEAALEGFELVHDARLAQARRNAHGPASVRSAVGGLSRS